MPSPTWTQTVWQPSSDSTCKMWTRADLGITQVTGSVLAWADQSNTGDANKNLSQTTPSYMPTWTPADTSYIDCPVLNFTASLTQHMQSKPWVIAPSQPMLVYVVGEASASMYVLDGLANNVMAMIIASTGNRLEIDAGAGLVTANNSYFFGKTIFGALFNNTTSSIYMNSSTATATGPGGLASPTGVTIGSAGAGTANPITGKIAEVAMFSGIPSAALLLKASRYFGARYGISVT